MILGNKAFFTKEHFEAQRGVAPAYLCELVVYCLELVSQLSHRDFEYRFKGGNSLLLLLEDPQRFSIDVDIVTTEPKEKLIELVETIAAECDVFERCEVRQHKTKPWLPMISFKIYFDSVYQKKEDAYVMLDAVLEPAPYGGVRKPVKCGELYQSSETVELPSISGLIADKLLCIGPATLGIPLGKKKEAQRLKHVFDVALLSRHPHDLEEVGSALTACMEQENRIQKSAWSFDEVARDTAEFCGEALRVSERPADDTLEAGSYMDEIARGFDGFRDYLFRMDYDWGRFQEDCRSVLTLLEGIEARR